MLPDVSFTSLLIVVAVAFGAPLLLGFFPGLRLPAVVLEILAGVLLGPSGLGWVRIDPPLQILSLIGLALLLLLAGLEVELDRLRGRLLRLTGLGFLLSFGLALAVGYGLGGLGLVETPLFVAIVLAATALGVIIPILKDSGESGTAFGQLVIAAATIADFGTIILLSLFFSRQMGSPAGQLLLVAGLALLAAVVTLAIARAERLRGLSAVLLRLQDTTAQIRVRGAFLLLILLVALAQRLGLEIILGAFLAGMILKLVDRDQAMTHPQLRRHLEAVGFGVFIPTFFVASGVRFEAGALFGGPGPALVPVFLLALLVVRGLPALVYRGLVGPRRTAAAGLLQATSLGFVVVAVQIGRELGLIGPATGAALVAAGLLSVLLFPLLALILLRGADRVAGGPAPVLRSRVAE